MSSIKIIALIIVVVILHIAVYWSYLKTKRHSRAVKIAPAPYQEIAPAAAIQMMSRLKKFILLDVRTAQEFASGHLKGAVLIPYDELPSRASRELLDKTTPVFIYCHAGVRSRHAAQTLEGLEYAAVYDTGAMFNWPPDLFTDEMKN